MKNFETRMRDTFNRDIIQKDGGKITYFQIVGFMLIFIGLTFFVIQIIQNKTQSILPDGIAISFFITMLGVAFAFPDLLKDQTKGISTMRIITFMFANVICMILLKIGWDKNSLGEIGLDGFWMGVIAFIFGAKATQKYFENAKSFIPTQQQAPTSIEQIPISKITIAQIAKVQNENKLQTLYPNIISVSDTLLDDGESCLTLYLEDNNQKDIPKYVTAQINENLKIEVKTEVISNSPAASTQLGQATDELSDSINPGGFSSFCVLLTNPDNPDLRFLATAGHNFTKGNFQSMGGFVYNNEQRNVLINGEIKGSLFYQRMHFTQDLAIVKLNETDNLLDNYISFNNGYKELTIVDVKTNVPNVTIASRKNENRIGSNIRDAFVLDINIPFDILYNGEKRRFHNVILLGNSNKRDKSNEVSMRGDSGSCVYCNKTHKLIGILIGGNGKFSFALPIKDVLEINNFKLI